MIKLIKHLILVNKHRYFVFKNMVHLGYPFLGLKHDLSKYSLLELKPSVKYFQGNRSPVFAQRKNEGIYSSIAVNHTKKNKHHYEYWIDIYKSNIVIKMMPYKYLLEYVADVIAASKAYNKKKYHKVLPYEYFSSHSFYSPMHKASRIFILRLLAIYSETGFKYLKKKNTKKIYKEIENLYPKIEIHPIDLNTNVNINID